jgi:hypothetical protein
MNIISQRGLLPMLAAAVVGASVTIEAQKPGAVDRYHSPQEAKVV